MAPPYDIITFDCYGTLVDWRAGITGAVERVAREGGRSVDPETVLRLHAEIEPQVQRAGYIKYRDVLDRVMDLMAGRLGWTLDAAHAHVLSESLPHWPIFPDTNPTLERLKSLGYRLGILSNVDNDLLAATRRQFTVEFDLLVTAEDVRSYKPAEPHFRTARRLIGGVRWLHAAQSLFHDIVPALHFGVTSVWINRLGEALPNDIVPNGNVADMPGLLAWLSSPPPRLGPAMGDRKPYMERGV
jgi:2-haloalkanoic acid dehalogenase type II